MLCKGTVWQGWSEDLLCHIWSAPLYQSHGNREVKPWTGLCGCSSWWLPSADVLDGCNRIYHVRKWTSRGLGVCICQEFSGTNDIRICIQPCTASSFRDTAGFSIHSLQVLWCPGWDWSCTALQALWGCPAWRALYSWCCGGPSRGFSGSTYERHAW